MLKGFITFFKVNGLMDLLGRCPSRLNNFHFGNNEQASIAVSTVVFCSIHAEHNLKQAVNSISEYAMWNKKKPMKFVCL